MIENDDRSFNGRVILLSIAIVGLSAEVLASNGAADNSARRPAVESADAAITLDKLDVAAKSEALSNTIDRKVYNVGKEIQGTSGSVSDLLQNIPSVQVDVDGNVGLRGDDSVLILIDGKPSTLMSAKNRADVLAQMPADSIDRIEVITNPSAKYKSDGTAGIINITTKRSHQPGFSGSLRGSVGNGRRGSGGVSANDHVGKFNFFGTVNFRQDDRVRTNDEYRRHLDSTTGTFVGTLQKTTEYSRPLSRLAESGVDYTPGDGSKLGASISLADRTFFRTSTINNISQAADGRVTGDYDRLRTDPEWEKTIGFTGRFEHRFVEGGRELKMEWKRERNDEQEDNHYTNIYRLPASAPSSDYTLVRPLEINTQFTVDYVHPFAGGAKLEAGYAYETDNNEADFRAGTFDPISGVAIPDAARTNQFIYRNTLHALYVTYGREFGRFGMLAGVRAEDTRVDTDQVTLHIAARNSYARLHPSLHLNYKLNDTSELQLNYSHRIHRPDGDDLNPFPEYQDPFNLRAGNPNLRPEETHSIEAGYQYRREDTSYLATLYYRETHDAFTTVTRYLDASTLLTTHENLASSRAGGLELAATAGLGSHISFNFSSNAYFSEVDASNLGYNGTRSTLAWEMKLNTDWHVTSADLIQINTNYRAKRLTAQGYRLPSLIANVGVRHDIKGKNIAVTLVVSDVFNSFKERTLIDTSNLHDEVTRRRNSRTVYVGFIYNFGPSTRKPKAEALKVDDSL